MADAGDVMIIAQVGSHPRDGEATDSRLLLMVAAVIMTTIALVRAQDLLVTEDVTQVTTVAEVLAPIVDIHLK